VSIGLWLLSCLVGCSIIAYFVTRMDGVTAILELAVREGDPAISESRLRNIVLATYSIALAIVGLILVLKVWLVILMAAQRNWARIWLGIVGVIGLPITAVVSQLLTDDTVTSRWYLLGAIVTQEVLVLFGLLTMCLPGPSRWFRLRLRR
jgi:hypothetical protein